MALCGCIKVPHMKKEFSCNSPDSVHNFGTFQGRKSSFPNFLSDVDVRKLAKSGFACVSLNYVCIGCSCTLNYTKGMDVDAEHYKIKPNCPWLLRRDRGDNMKLRFWYCLSNYMMLEDKGDHRYATCIKCDVSFYVNKVPKSDEERDRWVKGYLQDGHTT
jgi:hypothetical protein